MAAPALARYSGVLRRSNAFRMLFAATLGSGIGTWLAFLALTVDVFERSHHSSVWVSALLIADLLPTIVIGLTLGPLVDRLSRRWLMLGADLARCAIFAALPFVSTTASIVALAGCAGFATGFFRPAVYAGLPNLVHSDDLTSANSILQSVENMTVAAALLGGALVAVSGTHLVYWINAGTFLLSASFVRRIPGRLLQLAPAPSRGHLRDLALGFALVRHSRALLTVLVAWSIGMVASGFINVAEVSLAKVSFDSGDFGFGILVTCSGVGLVLGSLTAPRLIESQPVWRIYLVSLGLMGAGTAAAALSGSLAPAAAQVVLAGFGHGVMIPTNSLLVQRGAPDELRGRAFTLIMSSNFVMLGLAMAGGGLLTNALSARWTWSFAGCAALLAGMVGAALVRPVELRDTRGLRPPQADEPVATSGARLL
ncbi:MAG: MFS transporter [Gaiellaceae bacterium]